MPSFAFRARALFRWLVLDPIVLWAALGLPLVILPAVLILLPTTPELSIRIAGYLIALLGVLLVVKGIREKRKLFGRPAIVKRMTAWLRRLPPIVLPAKQASGNVTVSLGGTSISATGGVSAVLIIATPTVEERVRVLEENLRLIEGRMNSFREEARNSVEVLRSETTTERSVQHEAHVELSTRLEDLSVGGLDFEAAGVVWVIAGSALTTFPAELSTLVTKLF